MSTSGTRPVAPTVTAVARRDSGVVLSLYVPPELVWFDGHFPEVALLPGVVQTTWAIEQAREYFPDHFAAAAHFTHMSNMKFMRFIMPGAYVTLHLSYTIARSELCFEYRQNDRLCSSGRIGFTS